MLSAWFVSHSSIQFLLFILVDRVLALVSGHPITLSEVETEARIMLAMRGGSKAIQVQLDRDFICSSLDTLINQYLISAEANRLQLAPASEQAVQQAFKVFKMRFESPKQFQNFLDHLELTKSELKGILARHLWVEKLMNNRIKSRSLIMPQELENFYESHSLQYSSIQEAERHLLQQRQQLMLRKWLVDIKQRFPVTLITSQTAEKYPACEALTIR